MAYNIKLVCIFLHVMIFYEATVIQCQVLKEFVVRLGEPNRLKWEPLEEQLNQRANGIYTYNQNHGGNVKISSEFCFKGNDVDGTTYKIDFLQNGDTYPVYAMKDGEASIMPEFEVEKKASGWQVRRTGMGKHAGKWSDISSVIDQGWQQGPHWQQEITKVFDDSQVNTDNQICYYSGDLQRYFNVAFYKQNILQSFSNYNEAFKTGLNECHNNQHIAVQWSDLGWNRKRPICIRKVVGVRDPPQQPPPQQLRFLMGAQLQSSNAGASLTMVSLTQCQARVIDCERQLSHFENENKMLIRDEAQLQAANTQLRKEKDDSQKRAATFTAEMNRLQQSFTDCQNELEQLRAPSTDYIDEVANQAEQFFPDVIQIWPTSWNNIWDGTNTALDKERLGNDMRQSYAVFHYEVLEDIRQFIARKSHRLNRNTVEKTFYSRFVDVDDHGKSIINIHSYVHRLLFKKSSYLAITQQGDQVYKPVSVADGGQLIFTNDDNQFEQHLTYDEMKFNQQSILSSPTQLINNCEKGNQGKIGSPTESVFVGILGPKFRENNAMSSNPLYADRNSFENRLVTSLELFLFEANKRGELFTQRVLADITGIDDIEFSQYNDNQVKLVKNAIVETTISIIEQAKFPHIHIIQFGFANDGIDTSLISKLQANGQHLKDANQHKIQIHFRQHVGLIRRVECKNEDSDDTLTLENENCLLVAMYAGSSNTLPGNTFWRGDKTGSNEIDAASCSTIALTQNPYINEFIEAASTKILQYDEEAQTYFHEQLPKFIYM